jgi:hypothetical protein
VSPYTFSLVSWHGVRLSQLGTTATNWPIVPALDDTQVWSIWENENLEGKPSTWRKTATLPTINPTWLELGSNSGHCVAKLTTNQLGYGTLAFFQKFSADMQLSYITWPHPHPLTLTLKMEPENFSQISVTAYNTTWCYDPEDHNLITFLH